MNIRQQVPQYEWTEAEKAASFASVEKRGSQRQIPQWVGSFAK